MFLEIHREIPDRANTLLQMLIRALLIENDAEFAELVKFWLEESSSVQFDVHWEATLFGALSYLGESRAVDVALVDLGLSDSQGSETLAQIVGVAAEVPLIVLSAEERDSVMSSVIQLGAEDHIVKAECDGHTLIVAILNAIARHFQSRAA
jgi:DNA-binding response OmpR family regulator